MFGRNHIRTRKEFFWFGVPKLIVFRVARLSIPGQNFPSVKIYVRKVDELENKEVIPPKEVLDWGDYIYTDVRWITDNQLR